MCGIEHRFESDHGILLVGKGILEGTLEPGGNQMQSGYKYLFSFFVLAGALAAPSAMNAGPRPQDNGRQEERRRDDNDRNRFYDRHHKDYHNWDDNEDRSFRVYLGERHREYHPFVGLKVKEQDAYWNWRHHHPDHDHDGR
jgi:hypothetical protein